ncbi:hypothetical protein [Streptomyces kanamyceticus]|uniref:SRPBCC family protein n=1 Tax=Streptomyces kanamyceticus TaxID=1967 RepID=A0A5J6G6D3_STRKN|nr:hypothetical protein [Streptomyces kanamyceticus]QEU90184.1 hypothetical protein CP970_04035 [Streptomyces kanamyceticus]
MSDTISSETTPAQSGHRPPPSVLAHFPDLEGKHAKLWQRVRRSTFLPGADRLQVWEAATRLDGINAELAPVMRMTVPRAMRGDRPSLADVPLAEPLGRSWILLGRILPYDYDDVTIAEREEGHRFLEVSRMSSAHAWIHERTVDDRPGGAVLTDQLTYLLKPHLRPITPLYRRTVEQLFAHRHRRVARRFARLAPRPAD